MSTTWTNDQVERLSEALVKCDAMKHPANRNSVVGRLSDPIPDGITRGEDALGDTVNIVRRCSQFPEGPDELMRRVGFHDRGTAFFIQAQNVLETIKKELSDMGDQPTSPEEAGQKTTAVEGKTATPTVGTSAPPAGGQATAIPTDRPSSETPPATWEKVAAFAFGVVFLSLMIGIALVVKNPTPFQYTFFRVAMALAAAGVGAVIPGLIELKVEQKYMPIIRAGGAIALFVLVYLFNPPKL